MAMIENKWKKLKTAQRICSVLSVISWMLVILPFLLDYAGVAAVLYFVDNAWIVPFAFICAVGFTDADIMIGYRVYLHEKEDRGPRIHHDRKK